MSAVPDTPPVSRPCPDCGASPRLLFRDLRDRHFEGAAASAAGAWSIQHCEACDRYEIAPRPAAEEVAEFYTDYYTHGETEGPASSGFESLLKRAVPAATLGYAERATPGEVRIGRVLSWFPPLRAIGEASVMHLPAMQSGRLLDVGCGSGELLAHLQRLGWEVEGMEPDARGAEAARRALGGAEVHAALAGAAAPRGPFDVVTMSHVFEHLSDPEETLRQCFELLRPGGVLSLATPNPVSSGRRRFASNWLHWDPPRHLQLVTTTALVRVLEKVGFAVRRVSTSAASAHFAYHASWLIERNGRLPGMSLAGLPLSARLAGLAFWVREVFAARTRNCGEEVVAIAERPASRDA